MKMNKSRIVSILASGLMVANMVTPVAAANFNFTITGNGSDSNNETEFKADNNTTLVQDNDTHLNNQIKVNSNTGDNGADDNTGGAVKIKTGDTETAVSVQNQAGMNQALLNQCDACDLNVEGTIENNGSDSDNELDVHLDKNTKVYQNNKVGVNNNVYTTSNSGDNNADDTTNGDVEIETGDNDTLVLLSTTAGVNALRMMGGDGTGMLSLKIMGNGSDSDNEIDVDVNNDTLLTQDNKVWVGNKVKTDQESGDNSADDNTGGEVTIKTGDLSAGVGITNMTSFNVADIMDCGCVLDGEAKIAGNGTESESEIEVKLEDELEAYQKNDDDVKNDAEIKGDSGDNAADDNTGESDDPMIVTGASDAVVSVENSSGVNTLGDIQFEFDFDWSDLWSMFN